MRVMAHPPLSSSAPPYHLPLAVPVTGAWSTMYAVFLHVVGVPPVTTPWRALSSFFLRILHSLIPLYPSPRNIQPVVVVMGLKRQQAAALTNFVGCFLLALSYFSLLLCALNDLTGPSAGPLARTTYSIPFPISFCWFQCVRSALVASHSRLASSLASNRSALLLLSPRHASYAVCGPHTWSCGSICCFVDGSLWEPLRPTICSAFLYGIFWPSRAPSGHCLNLSRMLYGFSLLLGLLRMLGFTPSDPSLFNRLVAVLWNHLALPVHVSPSTTASGCHKWSVFSLFRFLLPSVIPFTFSCLFLLFGHFLFYGVGYCCFLASPLSLPWFFVGFFTLGSLCLSAIVCDLPWVLLPPSRLPPSPWVILRCFLRATVSFCHALSFSSASLSIGLSPPGFLGACLLSVYCLLSSNALFFPSLGGLCLSAPLPFPLFLFGVYGSSTSFRWWVFFLPCFSPFGHSWLPYVCSYIGVLASSLPVPPVLIVLFGLWSLF